MKGEDSIVVVTRRLLLAGVLFPLTLSLVQAAPPPTVTPSTPNAALHAYLSQADAVRLPDGRTLHMVCMGHGSPTVVLSAGFGNWGAIWFKVQPVVARHTRVCAWDRPGYGFSDPSKRPQTIDNTVRDLAAALKAGHVPGPYVMVGHSLGGLESMLYADRHPDKVVGMVLVDSTLPGMLQMARKKTPAIYAMMSNTARMSAYGRQCEADLRDGKLKPGADDPDDCLQQPGMYPPDVRDAVARFVRRHPGVFATRVSLAEHLMQDSASAVDPSRNYGNMPLVVLTASEPQALPPGAPDAVKKEVPIMMALEKAGHDRLAKLSAHGSSRTVTGTSHYIQLMKPEAVISAVNEVVDAARVGMHSHRGN